MAADLQQGAGESEDELLASINIIPFVDIVLVLLIIFMVTSTAIVRAALQVDLPKAASAGTAVAETVNVVYDLQRQLYVDGTAATLDELAALLRTRAAQNPEVQAVVSADQALGYGEVVAVIDTIKQSGVRGLALNVERSATTK